MVKTDSIYTLLAMVLPHGAGEPCQMIYSRDADELL